MDDSTARSRHPDAIRTAFLWALLPSLVLVLNASDITYSQVVVTTNITPTTTAPLDLGTNVDTVGATTEIMGGTRPNNGTNLFHSFDYFDLGTGDVAHFMNDMQLPTDNIFARVIGGEVSTIDGTLQTNNPLDPADPMNFGAANLWLVNPSGVLLGPNARVEVGGSVSISTANYLRFDGQSALFDMLSSPASLDQLTVAPVAAFGFLGPDLPSPITIQGSILEIPQGHSLSLVGGDLTVQAQTFEDGTIQAASLRAPGGQLNLVSVASPGEVLVPSFQTGPNINGASFTTMGTVTLKEGAGLDVSGQFDEFGTPIGNGNSGTVFVRGGQLVMDASTILANTVGAVDGAAIAVDIQVSQDVALSNGTLISAANFGSGRGGDVVIAAGNVYLLNTSTIITGSSGPGRGGDVHVTADSLTLENGSRMTTLTSGLGLEGGDLFLNVGALRLLGGSRIRSTNSAGTDLDGDGVVDVRGVGGNVTVQGTTQGAESAADSVMLAGGSRIESETRGQGGDGGRISITATSLDLDEASRINSSTAVTGTDLNGDGVVDLPGGRGGDIVVAVQRLSVVNGAAIASRTSSSSEGAAAGGTVTVQGLEGPGSKAGSVLLSGENTGIVSDSSFGVPGDITVNAGTLTVTNGAAIAAGSSFSSGPGGNVMVSADSVVISAAGQIFSRSFAEQSGQVTITANNALTLDNGSIDTSTSSETGGRAGDVVVRGGTVSLTNGANITSQSGSEEDQGKFSTGRAGDITITGESLTLANHSVITSSSKGIVPGAGDAGTITIQSGSTVLLNDSSITTEAIAASGGQIEINAPEMVRLINSEVSTSVKDGTGGGGNITIDPQFVILQNSQMIAQAIGGSGGAINVIAGVFLADPNSLVSASSQQGPQGTVNIQSPVQNLSEELTPLSQQFSSAAAMLAQRCAARVADGKFSTFVVAGREGLPAEPGGFLASPSLTAELFGSSLSGRYPHSQFPAVTGLLPEYDARPIQLAKYGDACHH
jgi:filamentous hemagglutinin family protein